MSTENTSWGTQAVAYLFGSYRLDTSNQLLFLNGRVISLTPRGFSVLRLLVEEDGRLVTKEDLIRKVWDGAAIEESNITKTVAEVRRVLRVSYGDVDPIRTVWKQGYRFDVPVERVFAEIAKPAEPAAETIEPAPVEPVARRRRGWPIYAWAAAAILLLTVASGAWYFLRARGGASRKPTVAVLQIRNVSGDPSTAWLSAALAETLTSELASGGDSLILSQDKVAAMRADLGLQHGAVYDALLLRRVRAALDADLAVTGAVVVSGNRLRLDLQVQDTSSGETRAWLKEDGAVDRLFELVSQSGSNLRKVLGFHAVPQPTPGVPANVDSLALYGRGIERLRVWDAVGAQEYLSAAAKAAPESAAIHAALATNWRLLGFDGKALEEARKAVEASAGMTRNDQLRTEAEYSELKADWPAAIETWRALCRFYPDQPDYVERLALALTTAGRAKEALATLRTVRLSYPALQIAEARASYALSDYPAAIRAASAAAEAGEKTSARLMRSRALSIRGLSYLRLSDFPKGRGDFQEAARLSSAAGDRSGAAEAMVNEAELVRTSGGPGADELLRQAEQISHDLGNRSLEVRALMVRAGMRRGQADMAGAKELLIQALGIAQETGDSANWIQMQSDLGNILNNMGDPKAAREHYELALARATETGDRRTMAIAMGNLGILEYSGGDLAAASARMQKALELKRETGNHHSTAYTLTFLGKVALAAGRLGEARRYFEESDKLLHSIQEYSLGPQLGLAELALAENQPVEAERRLMPLAEKYSTPNPGSVIWRLMAESWLARGDLKKARECADKALALAAKSPNRQDLGIPAALTGARVAAASGQFVAARATLRGLLAESRGFRHALNEYEVRLAAANVEQRSGNPRGAEMAFRSLKQDASTHGLGLIATQAEQLAGGYARAGNR